MTGKEKKAFINAVTELGIEKGVSKEVIQNAIEESFKIALNKKFENELKIVKNSKSKTSNLNKDGEKLPSALIRVDCNLDKAKINVYHQFNILNDDDITDDFIEMSIEEAKTKDPKAVVGGVYEEEIPFETLTKKDVDIFISTFRQAISAAEKEALYHDFADKIGTIYTGEVEKFDDHIRTCIVNLGKTKIMLQRKDLIGDETFRTGDTIKVYIADIAKDEKKNYQIKASRSCPEFLAKLFETEVNEIQDGTVKIIKIARKAGVRSKVAVYSSDPNVDPSGACIGRQGERIHKIVDQLGNGKEKIDVILYHLDLGVYLSEILKPGEVIGIDLDEANKSAVVICKNDTMRLAVGQGGCNIGLAKYLTGLEKIQIYNDSEAIEKGITSYKPIEEFIANDNLLKSEEEKKRFREANIKLNEARKNSDDENVDTPLFNEEELNDEEIEIEESPVEEIKEEKANETSIVETKQEEKKEERVEVLEREVKTTTTLEMLEKSLEEEKKNKKDASNKKSSFKKKEEKKEDKKEEVEENKNVQKMDIYTEEELQEFENEDAENDFDDYDDYSEYDSDDYYEDK